ncbi:type II secretion system minor pseudopilin GspH [Simiduia litorea]|uniref:type II secretion system minor pseudopilin GspH n=1 Tax=Simiduia litorea TaxID=1435348 RepID=UPI0036F26C8A
MTHARGFTLIELMVVLLIIGLAIGMVNFNLGGSEERKVRQEIDRYYQLLRFADESAALQGDLIGLLFSSQFDGQYSGQIEPTVTINWFRYRAGTWVPAEQPFSELTLPEGLALELRLDEEPVDITKEAETPQVIFSGSGEISNFEMRLSYQDAPIGYIAIDVTGDLVQADSYEP